MKFSFLLPHLRPGGSSVRVLELSQQLVANGHIATIYTPEGISCKWKTSYVPVSPMRDFDSAHSEYVVFMNPQFHKIVKKAVQEERCRQGIYYIIQDDMLINTGGIDPRQVFTDSSLVFLSASQNLAGRIMESHGIVPHVVQAGVNSSLFYPIPTAAKSIPLLTRGEATDTPWKGTPFFDEACILLSMRGEKLKTLNPTQDKMAFIYNAAEIYVSTSFYEGWNNCVLEAMACGVPVITTDDGGIKDFTIHKKNALIIPPGSAYAIKWAVRKLKDDQELASLLRTNGLETAKKYTWEATYDAFIAAVISGEKYATNATTFLKEKESEIEVVVTPKEVPQKIDFNKVVDRASVKGYLVDIIVPVHNALKEVKKCINSIIKNSGDIRYRILIINDASDSTTTKYLDAVAKSYPFIEIISNEMNIGYLKSINKGLLKYKTPYKVCLNSDTIVTPDWLDKLIKAAETDPKIGLVSPLTNYATSLTVVPPNGSNFLEVSNYITKHSKKLYPKACTVIGYCLLLTQKVIEAVGPFDELYDPGYYEECDYQYKAKVFGFSAIVCDNCYIYHKGQGSFKSQRTELINKNRNVFHSKWEKEYRKDYNDYDRLNALGYLRDKKTQKLNTTIPMHFDVMFVLPYSEMDGIEKVIALANELLLRGMKIGIATVGNYKYGIESSYIAPYVFSNLTALYDSNIRSKVFVAVNHLAVDPVTVLADKQKAKAVYLITEMSSQFDDTNVQTVISSYHKIKNKIVISSWLQGRLKDLGHDSIKIVLGVDTDMYYPTVAKTSEFTVLGYADSLLIRGFKDLKSVYVILKKLDANISCSFFGPYKDADFNHYGILDTYTRIDTLSKSHVVIDTSTLQSFSYLGLEAMSCGTAFLTTRNMGVDDYCKDGKNTLYANVSDPLAMALNILKLKNEPPLYESFVKNGLDTASVYNFTTTIDQFVLFFDELLKSN